MRVTKSLLQAQAVELNRIMGRPVEMFASKVGEKVRFNIGHITLDKNATGWQLEEQTGEGGSVYQLTARMSAKDISLFMNGMMRGVWLSREKAAA